MCRTAIVREYVWGSSSGVVLLRVERGGGEVAAKSVGGGSLRVGREVRRGLSTHRTAALCLCEGHSRRASHGTSIGWVVKSGCPAVNFCG